MRWLAARPIAPEDLKADRNAFTLLRWILASTVMYSHGWDLTQPVVHQDPSVAIFSFPVSRLAVFLFFTVSGFLVAGSLVKRGWADYLLARALRLLPGLWTMLIVITLGLGLLFGTLPLGAFLADPETHRFLWRNAFLIGGEFRLPGIFPTHPQPDVANGSLWTIPVEVRCYLALTFVSVVGLLQPRRRFTLLFLLAVAIHLAIPIDAWPLLANSRRLALSFFLGVLAWLWRDRLPMSWPLALAGAGVALAIPGDWLVKTAAIQLAFGYLVLVFAFRAGPLTRISVAMPDYSYGIYIYAFPCQQAAMALGAAEPLANIALGFALTLPLAAASWYLVEKPALDLKPYLSSRLGRPA
jgi:peptidoglycan/LPS O-acetylase OafA/YrhL